MMLTVLENYSDVVRQAADAVCALVAAKPGATLAFPTGSTPIGMYQLLIERQVDLSHATVFQIDEYLGLPKAHPQSFHTYMQEQLLSRVPVGRAEFLDGTAPDPAAEAARYEAAIAAAGDIDLAVLGLGPNGHIAYNEPGSQRDDPTRVLALSEGSRRDAAKLFGSLEAVPTHAVTVGIATLMGARQVLLLVSGAGKAEILKCALKGPVGPEVPASFLQAHPRLTVLADRAAGALL